MVANILVQACINPAVKKEATVVLPDSLIPNAETIRAMIEARRGNPPSATTIEQLMDAMNAKD